MKKPIGRMISMEGEETYEIIDVQVCSEAMCRGYDGCYRRQFQIISPIGIESTAWKCHDTLTEAIEYDKN